MSAPARPLRVAFVHPTLGLGGAERLMVNAALALQARGHRVSMHVAAYDSRRSFAAAGDGRLAVHVHAGWLAFEIDRKRVEEGKRVDLGGRRSVKK